MMRRKRVVKVVCVFIRVLVLIALVGSTLELKKGNYPEAVWQNCGIWLICYIYTLVFEKLDVPLIRCIIAVLKLFIIGILLGLLSASIVDKFATPLTICNIMASIGYSAEQFFRLVYWFEKRKNQ